MFARLLLCAGWLALLYLALVGCGDEDPVSAEIEEAVKVANLVRTFPKWRGCCGATNFDKAPRDS